MDMDPSEGKNDLHTLSRWITGSDNIVFFGGAGVSTESGIPDFRGAGGLYTANESARGYEVSPETILSASYFRRHPYRFFAFYREKILFLSAEPNSAHFILARLESEGRMQAVVTQNIDGLHQKAGSRKVIELHGSVRRNYCMSCARRYSLDAAQAAQDAQGIPRCGCGGIIRPDVVLYGEDLSGEAIHAATQAISRAEVLIVGGTSLSVFPAAGLVDYYKGNRFIMINESSTSWDDRADLRITGRIGDVLSRADI